MSSEDLEKNKIDKKNDEITSISIKHVKIIFFTFGISSICGWNSIISTLDFIKHFQGKYSPEFIYPTLNSVLYFIMNIFLVLKKFSTYKRKIIITYFLSFVLIAAFPFPVIFMKNAAGFAISLTVILSQCVTSSICTSSTYSIISYFSKDFVIYYSIGQGISGIISNILRYIILGAVVFKNNEEKKLIVSSIIYYSVSSLLLLSGSITAVILFKEQYYKKIMENSDENTNISPGNANLLPKEERETEDSDKNLCKENNVITDNEKNEKINENNNLIETNYKEEIILLFQVIKSVLDINLVVTYAYIVSLAVFPGIAINLYLFGAKGGYKTCTHSLIYNLFSTLGRRLTKNIKIEKKGFFIIAIGRSIFLGTFFLLQYLQNKKYLNSILLSFLVIINLLVCAFTNGLVVTIGYYLAPKQIKDTKYKGKVGATIGLFISLGFALGSVFSTLVMKKIKEKIDHIH